MYRISCLLISLLLAEWPLAGEAQHHWELSGQIGRTFRHTPRQSFDLPQPARALTLSYRWQTGGRRPWHHWQGFPRMGVMLRWQDFGNPPVLGQIWALMPLLEFNAWRWGAWHSQVQLAYGLGYVTRPFKRQTNPANNAIGSHLNNHTWLAFLASYPLSPAWHLRVGLVANHTSNAWWRYPNLGLNLLQAHLGVAHVAGGKKKRLPAPLAWNPWRPWYYSLRLGYGRKEFKAPNGPRYPIQTLSFRFGGLISPRYELSGGLTLSYSEGARAFRINQQIPADFDDAPRPWSMGVLLGHEWHFGRLGLWAETFLYLPGLGASGRLGGVRLGPVCYLWPVWQQRRFNPYLGLYLKAHGTVAEYAEFSAGLRF